MRPSSRLPVAITFSRASFGQIPATGRPIRQRRARQVRSRQPAASAATVASAIEGADWVLTVRDDGRGFDVGAVAARGRRNFGLQFMRERAELIGARFEVHSRPDGGTLVRLAIPVGAEENGS